MQECSQSGLASIISLSLMVMMEYLLQYATILDPALTKLIGCASSSP